MTAALLDRPSPATRPRARGWIHLYSAYVAVAMGISLVVLAATLRGAGAAFACAVYAATIIGLFSVSATYHRHVWVSTRARTWMKRADHSMIFVFIAGTYTPIAALALPPTTGNWVLWTVWVGALGGVGLKMLFPHAPRWLGVPFYIALGWVAIFVTPELLTHAGVAPFVLIVAGGLLYTVGAVFYATRRPNPWPLTFGYHELFHAAVSLAAACHCVAIWLALLG
ncbi:hemolysin III family protein [Nakamurella sp. YIM 132087]|uniref:Hemolysin III family protein n=1 Tax=Nakamurella alba TaxID=2665158 RepID=A0A7K1FFJ9_9ACTN|nr:hemolysin III family protein [Nakamurella alba]MTD12850.1 hemolysin III family protein [Nakamurella alba]